MCGVLTITGQTLIIAVKPSKLFLGVSAGVLLLWVYDYFVDSEPTEYAGDNSEPVYQPLLDLGETLKNNIFGTPYDSLITSSADTYGIPPEVLYKLLKTESNFRPEIIVGRRRSSTGALGIAQFMPATAIEEMGSVEAALNPEIAIPAAARYLAKLQRSFGGDLTKAVAAYNWGIGNVKRKTLARAPLETVNYVFKILGVDINA